MSKARDLIEAKAEMAEVRSWTCATCDTMVQTDGDHCTACAQYWQDVRNGVFDDKEGDDCDHDGYERDILTGRCQCTRCPHYWYQSGDDMKREEARQAEWDEACATFDLQTEES